MAGEFLGGAGTGAGIGFLAGGPVGAAVGAGAGGLLVDLGRDVVRSPEGALLRVVTDDDFHDAK